MTEQLNFLLADDDADDQFFFDKALKLSSISSDLKIVEDGEKLMHYLLNNVAKLPDVLFLDLNMPRKNGAECLYEIKSNKDLQDLPVIIYSTSMHESVADLLYNNGAHHYYQKKGLTELETMLNDILILVKNKNLERPERGKFILQKTLN